MRVVVLISGRGSNLEALLKHQQNYIITHVISNNFNANGIKIAQRHGVTNTCINWSDKNKAENTLIDLLQKCHADLIILAGFMRILSNKVIQAFPNKIINIHPSLLPKYPGLNTHQKVIENNDIEHGATVHLVDDQLDHGKILAQTRFTVDSAKDAKMLAEQLILKEHKLLTTVMGLIGSTELRWNNEQLYVHGKLLTKPLNIN